MESLKIASWNCYGLKRNKETVVNLSREVDIIALQETLLWPHDLPMTDNINPEFHSFSKSSINVTNKIVSHRPFGGLSFLWHKKLGKYINIINYDNDRLLGMKIAYPNHSILIINTYMPWENPNNFDDFAMLLGEILSIIDDSDADHYCIIGDLNAHPFRRFFDELSHFCNDNSLIISDTQFLPQDSFTYLNYREENIIKSWLDHCLCSQNLHNSIRNCKIRHDLGILRDHLPIQVEFAIPNLPGPHNPPPRAPQINWKFENHDNVIAYTSLSEVNLRNVYQPAHALLCDHEHCNNEQHKQELCKYYSDIIDALLRTGSTIFGYMRQNRRPVPGWNDYVRDIHNHAKNIYSIWRENGSPRHGFLAQMMRRTRAHFKLALRFCRANEAQLRADAFSTHANSGNHKNLWKGIQSLAPKSRGTAQKIGDAVGEEEISELWATNTESILNCINDRDSKNRVEDMLTRRTPFLDRITTADVREAIKNLAGNKAQGCDGLPAEAYKFAHPILCELLASLFNACIIHQYLPDSLMLVHIIPLIKNKLRDSSDPNNYRPIAITTIISKILESVLLRFLAPFLSTTDNQFGFKENHSTDACIYILKELINYYVHSGSPIYMCFVDVRKAFDRVNYHKLFLKLMEKGAPKNLVGLLNYWFSSQKFCVSWGNTLSRCFGSSNGLRQGGILSPHLFNLYTDELNIQLNSLDIGCSVNGHLINNLCYADDMVLISPSAKGLQRLINVCCQYANAHDIIYNETKTQCMLIRPRELRHIAEPRIMLEHHHLEFVNEFPYLGHIISSDLKDNTDIENRRRKLCALGNMITRRYGFCNIDTKILLFQSYCYSIYGSSLWTNYTQEQLRRLKVVHNDILRRLTRTPRFHSASELFVNYNLRPLKVIIRHSMTSLVSRLLNSTNVNIVNVLNSGARVCSKMWQKWENEAFVNPP